MKRLSVSVAALVLFAAVAPSAGAQLTASQTHYTDVAPGAYYEEAAAELLRLNALDASEPRLRPGELATRAELVKLLVRMRGSVRVTPAVPSFDDVAVNAWYYGDFETAASEGLVRGDDNCYGTKPCTARPGSPVNRAEAAALLLRAFDLEPSGMAPVFPDNPSGEWYHEVMQTAADNCVLQGDSDRGTVRPASLMNRAEMVVMFYRASQDLRYGIDCGEREEDPSDGEDEDGDEEDGAGITDAQAVSHQRVRLRFNVSLDQISAQDEGQYTINRLGGLGEVTIKEATLVDTRTVDLSLWTGLVADGAYVVNADGLQTAEGATFSDIQSFTYTPSSGTGSAVYPGVASVDFTGPRALTVTFTTDLDRSRAGEIIRYYLVDSADQKTTVRMAKVVDNRTVDLTLTGDLQTQDIYTITVLDLRDAGGALFSDEFNALYDGPDILFAAALTGSQEIPFVVTNATGSGTFRLASDGLHYDVTVQNLSGGLITAAHFHRADRNSNGPAVHPIDFGGTTRTTGVWTNLTQSLRYAILHDEIYVNVHTQQNPNGEIRGQVRQ